MLVPEGVLGLDGVRRDAEHSRSGPGEGVVQPREVDRLPRATGRVGARVEKKHEFLAVVIGERDGVAAIARQPETGGLCALNQAGRLAIRLGNGLRIRLRRG